MALPKTRPRRSPGRGCGALTEIDIQATLKTKLSIEMAPYKILGACNPPAAHRALQAEPLARAMLPCNVVLRDADSRRTEVAAVENETPGEIAAEIRDCLRRAVDAA